MHVAELDMHLHLSFLTKKHLHNGERVSLMIPSDMLKEYTG
jgi:hypothetical protein